MAVHAESGKGRHHAKRSPVGASPGTLIADPAALPSRLRAVGISPTGIERFDSIGVGEIAALRARWPLLWVDCVGLGDANLIGEVGTVFGLHRLALEDVLNTGQRPKADFFDDHVFVVLKMIDEATPETRAEQLSLFFGQGFVVTFQENEGDCFDPVRQRLELGGRLVTRGADYLAYALLDAIVDGYFPLLERKSDAIGALIRTDSAFVAAETKLYLNDSYDHAVRLIEMVETFRDTLTGLIELHLSLQQARTNEVVNLLTIVSTIFIPLTFLAGIWGMNFDPDVSVWNMPELDSPFGYPMALGLMAVIAIMLIIYFRWKKWL
jgi:magnesium transporter